MRRRVRCCREEVVLILLEEVLLVAFGIFEREEAALFKAKD
jgi:hypothetical protein